MNEPGSERKYTKIYRRLSNRLIQSHLRGDITRLPNFLVAIYTEKCKNWRTLRKLSE